MNDLKVQLARLHYFAAEVNAYAQSGHLNAHTLGGAGGGGGGNYEGRWVAQPLLVREPGATRGYAYNAYEEIHELSLLQLLTMIVQGMEQLGVKFEITPAKPAEAARVDVSIKKGTST
jgi:hypothetical protein